MKTTTFPSRSRFASLLCVAGFLVFLAAPARADEDKDPPSRVARLSVVDGSVSMQPGGQGDWGNAERNRPVTIGDKIWVDKDSRAELQAGQAAFHLGSMTALSFLNLDEGMTQVRIPEGAVNFRVRELRQGDVYEVDTPNVVFTVKEAGAFRVDVSEAGDSSRFTVIRGQGEISADGKTYEVRAGEQAEFNGAENPTYTIGHAPGPDGLDRWAEERDVKEDRSASGNYVSRDMPGYDDLDENGRWRDEPEYGHVWYPNDVGPDWAPYSDGYWSWVAPWGWSWVGYEPWGFAPYHYGRWAYIGGAWGWCPGPYFGPPCYGPAFVGFLGGGWGFGFGFGVGWFPLGWGEPFFPWFHCSRTFVNVINVHNTFIHNVNVLNGNGRNINFVNAHNLRAVTTTSRNGFVNGQRVNRGQQHITQASLNNAKVTNSVGIRPTAHSTLGAANFNSHVARPSTAVQNRAVMARTAPAATASHLPVRTMGNAGLSAGRSGNPQVNGSARAQVNNSGVDSNVKGNGSIENRPGNARANSNVTARQRELSQNRPPSAMPNSSRAIGNETRNNSPQRPANNSRTWEAQGNATDGGRAPQGVGSDRPANAPAHGAARMTSDRPPWAGHGDARSSNGVPASPNYRTDRPNSSSGRSYAPPSRNYSSPSNGNRGYSQQPSYTPRTYSSPGRSYPAQPRSYSAPPSRSYSAPSRSYSAPSRSYGGYGGGGHSYGGGGGGSYHGGGGYTGGGSHSGGGGGHASSGGGGGSHGGGGGHPRR